MTYDECMDLLDFLNYRLRSFRNPWYTWAIDITWEKLFRWAKLLGYTPPANSWQKETVPLFEW